MYRDLIYATPGLQAQDIAKYFEDLTFGVRDADIASTISPRSDVTIVRDRQYGVPHIYGTTGAGAMFGTGYARTLLASLRSALAVPDSRMYHGDEACKAAGRDGHQACYDAVRFRPRGGLTQPLMPWINRPTYQQAVEVQGHRPR